MSKNRFRLRAVAYQGGTELALTYESGELLRVDVGRLASGVLAPLADPAVVARAALGEWGWDVTFGDDDELTLAADNLHAEAVEQAGGISHERLWSWMHRNGLTLDTAAEALGMSRRMVAYYRSGAKPIPKYIWLACIGWEAQQSKRVA